MSPYLLALLLSASTLGGPRTSAPPVPDSLTTWESVILAQLERHPRMGMDDLYKLLHQGALGSEHAVADEASVRQWMDEELAVMGSAPAPEPLVDTIAPNGRHVRIHLRPYVAQGGDPEALLEAFIATANGESGSADAVHEAMEAAVALAERGALPWETDRLEAYLRRQADAGYPAEHHSRGYWSLYRPAYRVVSGTLVPSLLATLEKP